MAAPHATAVCALMLSYLSRFNTEATVHDIYDILRSSATSTVDIGAGREGQFDDIGVVDAYNAIKKLSEYVLDGRTVDHLDGSHCRTEASLVVTTDEKGYETAYRLKRLSDGKDLWMKGPNSLESNKEYYETICLDDFEDDCYRFDIRDSGADGINGSGISLSYGSHNLYNGGQFGKGGMLKFGGAC